MEESGSRTASSWKVLLVWVIVLVCGSFVLAKLDYFTRDADSMLYSEIAEQISHKPLPRWIAPVWVEGLFREHPVGIFLLPALLAHLGYPALQASYVANAFYQILTLLLFPKVAAIFAQKQESRSLAWILQLLPIAFVYRIRANHEQALLLCLLLALYATERSRVSARWIAVSTVALVFMMLVKGMAAFLGVFACLWWLLLQRQSANKTEGSFRAAFGGILVAVFFMTVVAVLYELAYRHATGQSFLHFYIGRWLARPQAAEGWRILPQKMYNIVWYTGRLIWYAFPWSLFALALLSYWKRLADLRTLQKAGIGAIVALGIVVIYQLAFSLSDQKAGRYLFPAYYVLGSCGVIAAIRASARVRRMLERTDRWSSWLPVALWTLTFVIHLLGGPLKFPRIHFWRRDF